MNGLAYALLNVLLPGQRTPGSLALEGRAVLNWIATGAMLIFAGAFLRTTKGWKLALSAGVSIGLIILTADILAVRAHFRLLEFGGIAIYPATAFVLGIFPIVFADNSFDICTHSALLGGALAINSVDHLGAELIQPSPTSKTLVILQMAAMVIVLVVWLWISRRVGASERRLLLLVVVCMVVPFLAGMLVREMAASYVGVQRSGFIGVGRLAATALLIYGMLARSRSFATRIAKITVAIAMRLPWWNQLEPN